MTKHIYLLLCLALSLCQSFGQQPATTRKVITQFYVRAVDEKSQELLPVDLEIKLYKAKKEYKAHNEPWLTPFMFLLYESDTVEVKSKSDGYYSYTEILVATCDTCPVYQHTITMEKKTPLFDNLKVNDVIKLDRIYFDQSSFILRSESYQQLEDLYKALKENPTIKIEIAGHTDNVGNAKLNKLLSENRAKVIHNYLIGKGIDSQRLSYVGYGQTKPVSPNDTEENKSKNRRVECIVLAK
jgi:outer membrane protein OmpA-like peptidoglycan-associated protein